MAFDVVGNYRKRTVAALKEAHPDALHICALAGDGEWHAIPDESSLNPFRIYFTMTERPGTPVKMDVSASVSMRIFVIGEDDVTDIKTPQTVVDGVADEVYDLMGRRVLSPRKGGLYIVNGRKQVIR